MWVPFVAKLWAQGRHYHMTVEEETHTQHCRKQVDFSIQNRRRMYQQKRTLFA